MDEKLFPDTSSYYKKTTRRPRGILLIVLLLILLLTGLFVGIRFFGGEAETRIKGMLPESPSPSATQASPTPGSVTPTPQEEVAPTEGSTTTTPAPTAGSSLTRSSLSVSVENGSGVSGAASDMAATLRDLGYKIAATGNADTFDYEDVTIKVKPTKRNYLKQLQDDLSEEYTVADATADLSADETADAVVIIGE